jgi:plastocyanin
VLSPVKAVVVAASLAALVLGAAGGAHTATPKTTGVDPLIRIAVRITDNQITVSPKKVARMETAYFRVVNSGKRTHDFRVGGQKSPPLKHGQVGHVLVQFVDRGVYLYRCALNCSTKMRGYVQVYSPIG